MPKNRSKASKENYDLYRVEQEDFVTKGYILNELTSSTNMFRLMFLLGLILLIQEPENANAYVGKGLGKGSHIRGIEKQKF